MSSLVPYILEAYKFDGSIRKLLDSLARKCFPDYYNVGDYVFLTNIDEDIDVVFNHYIRFSDRQYSGSLTSKFKITNIIDQGEFEPGLYRIELAINDKEKLTVPFYKSRPIAKDAAYYLKRYDKEY